MNWIERKRMEAEQVLEKMKTMYHIPMKCKDSSKVFHVNSIFSHGKYSELKELMNDWNQYYEQMQYQIPEEIGIQLEQLYSDSNYTLGIHRTSFSPKQIQIIIFTQG